MDIRPYQPEDYAACLEVFDSNAPDLLRAEMRPEFSAFLDGGPATFFVAEHDGAIVGCGGYEITANGAWLRWGMVRRQWQRQGLGRFLLFYRMRQITKDSSVELVSLTAPRAAAPFFSAQGFREAGAGDRGVEMVKRLIVCA